MCVRIYIYTRRHICYQVAVSRDAFAEWGACVLCVLCVFVCVCVYTYIRTNICATRSQYLAILLLSGARVCCVCVCVCEREREKERECVCVCLYVCVCIYIYVQTYVLLVRGVS